MTKGRGFSLYLGLRNFHSFRGGRRRTMAGAAVAAALSIIPLIVVLEVSDGMIEGITRRFIELETGHVQVYSFEERSAAELEEVSRELENYPEIMYAAPVCRGMGIVYSKDFKAGIGIKALPPDIMERDEGFRHYLEITDGSFDLNDDGNIMLSAGLADELGVSAGEKVKLLTAKNAKNGKLILRPEEYDVAGVFSTGYYEVDSMTAYISLGKGEKIFRENGQKYIQCKISDPYDGADRMVRQIQDDFELYSATTWYRLQKSMYESLYTTRVLLIFIMAVIVVVAAFNITSSLIIMVYERRQDIAILKSCGASNKQIRAAFIFTGMFTGIAGAAGGIAAGLCISMNINSLISGLQGLVSFLSSGAALFSASSYYLEQIPVTIRPLEIVIVGISAVILSSAAAVLPARKAEKMSPIEILQKH